MPLPASRAWPAAALALALALPRATAAQAPPAPSPDRLDAVARFVDATYRRLGLPGVAISVATADSVVLARAYGGSTTDGRPLTAQTPFHLGSVTKTLTATLVVRLAQDGRLDLDAPVESTLPAFTMRGRFVPGSLTARHLLQHRSGFSQWSGHDRRAQATGRVDHLAPRRAPDLRSEYSSLNFIVAGRLAAAAADTGYAEALHAYLLDPLRMDDAFVRVGEPLPAHTALGHQSYFGWQRARREPEPLPFLVPAGFVGASAVDLGRFGGLLLGGGAFGGVRVLDSATVAGLLGPLDTVGRALGWGRSEVGGRLVLEHAGNARTSSARVRLVPADGYAITVLTNTNTGPFFSATADLTNGIDAILRGEPAPRVWPRERLLKAVILAGLLVNAAQAYHRGRAWNDAGRPTHLDPTGRVLGPLAIDVVGATVLLVGLPRVLGVPIGTMTEYFPDLGIAIWSSAIMGVSSGTLRAFTRSAP